MSFPDFDNPKTVYAKWVWFTKNKDCRGNPMVAIGPGVYPQSVARKIAKEIIELIGPDEPGTLQKREGTKF